MATSKGSFPRRATLVDKLTRTDHYHLDEDDRCLFIGEYTAGAGFGHSETNQLIFNLKKGIERRGERDWRYKREAIVEAGRAFKAVLREGALNEWTFVPMPPSKARDDSQYDDRMLQVVRAIRPAKPVDARELVVQSVSTPSMHRSVKRLRPQELAELYFIDEELAEPMPAALVIVDDLLTTGAHFKAAKLVLTNRFPEVPVIGLFIARRVPEKDGDVRLE